MENTAQYTILDEVSTFLVSRPTLEQITEFTASEAAQLRLRYLLDANREGALTDSERVELDDASRMDHFMSMLKIKAHKALAQAK